MARRFVIGNIILNLLYLHRALGWEDECKFVRRITVYHVLTLKMKFSYFTSKNGFIWEQQRIAIQDKQAIAEAMGKSNKQRRGTVFYGEKEGRWERKARFRI